MHKRIAIGRSLKISHFDKNNLAIVLYEMGHLAGFISSHIEFGYWAAVKGCSPCNSNTPSQPNLHQV
ncbi:hypothetical protein [Nostoc sp.]|uniref:hypothetical protein n=1 Tax=Nostoc sp. TaxID=1180 RepID=UPI002FF61852